MYYICTTQLNNNNHENTNIRKQDHKGSYVFNRIRSGYRPIAIRYPGSKRQLT